MPPKSKPLNLGRFTKLKLHYLAADPTDSEAEGRLKNAVEGLGLGALTEGVMLGLKAIRAARSAGHGGVNALNEPPELKSVDQRVQQDPNSPRVSIVGETVEINFAHINSGDDVKAVMQELADNKFPDIDKARRGKRSHAETEAAADEINAFDVLLNKRAADPTVTKPLTAEETVAARRLWTSSAEKLLHLAELAASNPSEVNLFNFRRMVAVHCLTSAPMGQISGIA